MRRPFYHHDQRGRLDVKMTPMIDVIFLLLIFFVCTASFDVRPPEEILPTHLSMPGTIDSNVKIDPELLDLDQIVVKVLWREARTGWRARWEINQREYKNLTHAQDVEDVTNEGNVEDTLRAVKQVKVDLPVILDVDRDVPMHHVIDVYDLCRAVGLARVQFAASVGA